MVAVIVLQAIVLIAWNVADPLIWQREVLSSDRNGYPTKSIGTCSSNNGLAFLIPLVVIDALMLFYALYLCFITRKVSAEYQEGTWITASILSILQILVLSIPILVIVDNDNSAFYFVRVAVIFLVSVTVTVLIFFPKMYRLHVVTTHNGRSRRLALNPRQMTTNDSSGQRHSSTAGCTSVVSDRAKRLSVENNRLGTKVAFQVVGASVPSEEIDEKQDEESGSGKREDDDDSNEEFHDPVLP